jgi:hypothetical protein
METSIWDAEREKDAGGSNGGMTAEGNTYIG